LNRRSNPKGKWEAYSKYSGMAFQMILIIVCGTFAGKYLDVKIGFQRPTLTIVFALISVGFSLYYVLKEK
jgi:ATP synthase protein I